jgi:hypothetical protein
VSRATRAYLRVWLAAPALAGERQRKRDPEIDPGKGVGERLRQTKGGGDPRWGGAGHGKQSQAGPGRDRVGAGLGETEAGRCSQTCSPNRD